eukprot:GHUV01016722.1.p1 GENE.GHUV01016722.1~~GHUV01016722.1.p1  ORF type:complete len:458 (+),score=126.66 GHUV01016722.1:249-1622(+)
MAGAALIQLCSRGAHVPQGRWPTCIDYFVLKERRVTCKYFCRLRRYALWHNQGWVKLPIVISLLNTNTSACILFQSYRYEDVLHEGNLDEDTPHEDYPPPGDEEQGRIAEYDRQKKKYPQYMAALMQRFGGHPYETMDMLPFNVVDPVKKTPLENLWAMGHNRNELPPELHPYNFPELLLLPVSPLKEHDHQIRMEAILSRNLDAALRNTRKPYMLEPTAGTVPCPSCYGTPYTASLFPNVNEMFRCEVPTWQRVLGRMGRYATQPRQLADAEPQHYLEYPQQDAAVSKLQGLLAAELEGPPGRDSRKGSKARAVRKGARASVVGGRDLDVDPSYLEDWALRGLAMDTAPSSTASSSEPEQFGPMRMREGGPLTGSSNAWIPSSSKRSTTAALVCDVNRLKQVQGTAAEQEVMQQLQQRYSPAAVQAMMAVGSSSRSSSGRPGVEAAVIAEAADSKV